MFIPHLALAVLLAKCILGVLWHGYHVRSGRLDDKGTKYASAQWERYFTRNKHARKKDISADFTASELESVKDYLIRHAADSDQPEAIGLR